MKTIKRMSDIVIECELRGAWAEVMGLARHGLQPGKRLSDYICALLDEQKARIA